MMISHGHHGPGRQKKLEGKKMNIKLDSLLELLDRADQASTALIRGNVFDASIQVGIGIDLQRAMLDVKNQIGRQQVEIKEAA